MLPLNSSVKHQKRFASRINVDGRRDHRGRRLWARVGRVPRASGDRLHCGAHAQSPGESQEITRLGSAEVEVEVAMHKRK